MNTIFPYYSFYDLKATQETDYLFDHLNCKNKKVNEQIFFFLTKQIYIYIYFNTFNFQVFIVLFP